MNLDKDLIDKAALSPESAKNLQLWLADAIDPEIKSTLRLRLKEDPKSLESDFFSTLSFGTGGVRALMGLGSAKLNTVTLGLITQGLANNLKKKYSSESLRVLIGYDSRHNAHTFSKHIAEIFAANGIEVFLLKELRPTPFISFLLRHLKCHAAVNLTASHNPKEYSGYKVYGKDGAQVVSPEDKLIVEEVKKVASYRDVKTKAIDCSQIHEIGSDYDNAYLSAARELQLNPAQNKANGDKLSVIYSSLHGTGITLVPRLIADWGFSTNHLVETQMTPDGDFPTVEKPNPEELEALAQGSKLLSEIHGDLFIATDPDADRIGAVIHHRGELIRLSGNEMAVILLSYILESLKGQNKLSTKSTCIKTIVTTELFKEVCAFYSVNCIDTLTGFKYIGEKIHTWEQQPNEGVFIFGAEESYGCLYGTCARDKDAVLAAGLIAECALHAKLQKKTLVDELFILYRRFGIYRQKLSSIDFKPGPGVQEKVAGILENLRKSPPNEIGDLTVTRIDDYESSKSLDLGTNTSKKIDLPKSNVLTFHFGEGGKLTLRGSGTEPKLKVYSELKMPASDNIEANIHHLDRRLEALNQSFEFKYCVK